MVSERLANVIVVVVTLVWLLNFGLNAAVPSYDPPPEISGVFGLIVGGAMALRRNERHNGNGGTS